MLKVLSLLRLQSKCFYIDCDYYSDVIISSCRLLVRNLAVYENIVEFVENNNDNKDNNNNSIGFSVKDAGRPLGATKN